MRFFPLDVWPGDKEDHATLLQLVDGCAEVLASRPFQQVEVTS